jgi:hypothetical protein
MAITSGKNENQAAGISIKHRRKRRRRNMAASAASAAYQAWRGGISMA